MKMSTFPKQWIPLQKQLVPKAKQPGSTYRKNSLRRHKEAIDTALKCGYLKLLDQKLILESQLDSERHEATELLEDVLRISLNGCSVQALDDIAVLSCVRLRICNLASCYVSDISAFYGSVNLLKLDVSNNQIGHLPPPDFWSSLSSLRVLFLNGNAVSERETISKLNNCPELHVLTLHGTPIALMKNYRHHVVNSIFTLRALDRYVISDEEIVENLHLSDPFRPLSNNFKVQLYKAYPVGTSYKEELSGTYSMLLAVSTVLANYSPVMIVQRWTRGWLVRRALAKSTNPRIRAFLGRRLSSAKKQTVQFVQSSLSHSASGRKTISAEVPMLVHSSQERRPGSIPPPPPTTPRQRKPPLGVETHIIGMDEQSSRLKYTMHINLRMLHQNVTEVEETVENEKTFRSAFQRKRSKGIKTPSERGQRRNNTISTEVEKKSPPKLNIPEQQSSPKQESVRNDISVKEQESKEDTMQLPGKAAQVLPHEALPDLATCRKGDGRMIREAEKEINRARSELKQPSQKPSKPSNAKALSKEDFLYTRAYTTMALSGLTAAEKIHNTRKKNDELIRKANLVARIRQERVLRNSKIEDFWDALKENNRDWKSAEEQKLVRMKEKLENRRKTEILERMKMCDTETINMQTQAEDQQFASKFNQQNAMVVNTLSKEDRRLSKDSVFSVTKERVQEARAVTHEQQELVTRYMEMRKTKLLQEGATAKNELDTKMVEAVSHRLIEAKRKVAKEVARKQAARTAIALAKEDIRRGPHHPGECIPAPNGPPVKLDTNPDARKLETVPNKSSNMQTPPHIRRISRQAHKTWQRGSETLRESVGHFPLLPLCEESPMMYDMMHPGLVCKSRENTPFSELDSSCTPGETISANSLLISRCQKNKTLDCLKCKS